MISWLWSLTDRTVDEFHEILVHLVHLFELLLNLVLLLKILLFLDELFLRILDGLQVCLDLLLKFFVLFLEFVFSLFEDFLSLSAEN